MKWAVLALACALITQGEEKQGEEKDTAAEIDKLIGLSREGSAVVRPQAARRLVSHGKAAAEKLVLASEGGSRALAKLGPALIAVLPDFDDARLRDRLWAAVDDRDFPWRPAAAMGLARTALSTETQITSFVTDPIALVRLAGVEGIDRLDLRARIDLLYVALADADDRVRRRAAFLLDEWGDHGALLWLVEELRRDDYFFGNPTGRIARYEAAKMLRERLGDDLKGIDPARKPNEPEAVAALAELEKKVLARIEGEPPEVPRAFQEDLKEIFGLEIRSCRRGEFYFRVDAKGMLWVGTGHPDSVPLPPGIFEKLVEDFEHALTELGDEVFWGEPGCDAEVFYWRPGGEGRTQVFQVSKGAEAVRGLRPEVLGKLAKRLAEAIPDERFRTKILEALKVTGGELP